ncbi:MAG: imidazole glycerol phosphate synthase subunit HisH [Hyphomicrobium sp.]|nr:imidazole glycerol phosphate synthase subunit HisH [Hyphomicrobium sp.]
MQRVVIIDYGSGNLHSAAKAFERAAVDSGTPARIIVSPKPEDVAAADRVVLPGVGAYGDCKRGLDAVPGLLDTLDDVIRRKGRPFLGICVGMQLMSERGREFQVTEGFGWIKGEVRAIETGPEPSAAALKIPHMGWNTLNVARPHPLLDGIATGPTGLHAYFVHSFHLAATERRVIVAETDYGGAVTAMVADDNIAGTQFHPEKSQTLGLKLLANFLRWTP